MKKILLTFITLMVVSLSAIAQSNALYVYKHNGECFPIVRDSIVSMSYSHYDENNIYHDDWQVQEVQTTDSLWRIPLSEVDSICMFAPKPELSISSAYVPLDKNRSKVLSGDIENYRFVLTLDDTTEAIKPGSVLTLDADTAMYIVLVTEIEKHKDRITVKGAPGDLSYLFSNTEFTATTKASSTGHNTYIEDNVLANSRKKIIGQDEWAEYTAHLWNKPEKKRYDIYKGDYLNVYTDYAAGLSLNLDMKFRFGRPVESFVQGLKFIKAAEFDVDVSLVGKANAGADFTTQLKFSKELDLAPEQEDNYEVISPNLFPPIHAAFTIGIVTIPLEIGGGLYGQVTLTGDGEMKYTMGFEAEGKGVVGVKYNGSTNKAYNTYSDWSFSCTPHHPTLSGDVELEGKVYVFPRIHVWLCNLTGPSIDIKPYLRSNISIGFCKDLIADSGKDYNAWSLTTAAGVDWAVGWSTRAHLMSSYEGSNKSLFKGTWTKDDWKLYQTPKAIEYMGTSEYEIRQGQPVEVEFLVTDDTFLKDIPTPFPQVVKFESKNGKVKGTDGAFSTTKNGYATVTWWPQGVDDELYAKIFDRKGQVIAEANYPLEHEEVYHSCPDNNHPHIIDLGLPSGTKWACCNVGASKPEEYGGYYAWGETSEKSYYDWETYKYCNGSDKTLTKYCCFDYYGIVDKKRELAPEDDAAYMNWGNGWRMPSEAQQIELYQNCTRTWDSTKKGCTLVGPNKKTLFLPAAGTRHGGSLFGAGSSGCYWSRSLRVYEDDGAFNLHVTDSSSFGEGDDPRCSGYSVRPVRQ